VKYRCTYVQEVENFIELSDIQTAANWAKNNATKWGCRLLSVHAEPPARPAPAPSPLPEPAKTL
jgi:hypothetical protein